VKDDYSQLCVAYVFTFITTIVGYISIFYFWRGTRTWFDFSGKHEMADMGYSQLNKHCVLLKGIPKHMSPVEATDHIKRVLNKVDLRTSQEKLKDEQILKSKRILEKEEQDKKKMAEAEGNLLNQKNEAAIVA